jgi:hypothetical protein
MVHLKCKKPQYSKKEKERKKNQMPKSIVFLVAPVGFSLYYQDCPALMEGVALAILALLSL